MTTYFADDVLELIEKIDGKGTLINELIREHFSKDEETIRRRVTMAEQELNALKARLSLKVEQRHAREAQKEEAKKEDLTNKQIFAANKKTWAAQVKAKEITFEQFKQLCDDERRRLEIK